MINKTLFLKQLKDIFLLLFRQGAARIVRIIKECGRSRVPWVLLENRWGQRRATFVAFRELNRAFLEYLTTLDRLKLRFDEKLVLDRAMYILLQPGYIVFKLGKNTFGVVVEKLLSPGKLPTVWIDWGNGVPFPEQPSLLEIF